MKKQILLMGLCAFLWSGCDPIDPPPPKRVNKFTCKVDGVFWESIPKERSVLGNDLEVQEDPLDGAILVYASNALKDQGMTLDISNHQSSETCTITTEDILFDYSSANCGNHKLDTTSIRRVIITEHDKVKHIIKGTFQFSAITTNGNCGKAVITDGFFDLAY